MYEEQQYSSTSLNPNQQETALQSLQQFYYYQEPMSQKTASSSRPSAVSRPQQQHAEGAKTTRGSPVDEQYSHQNSLLESFYTNMSQADPSAKKSPSNSSTTQQRGHPSSQNNTYLTKQQAYLQQEKQKHRHGRNQPPLTNLEENEEGAATWRSFFNYDPPEAQTAQPKRKGGGKYNNVAGRRREEFEDGDGQNDDHDDSSFDETAEEIFMMNHKNNNKMNNDSYWRKKNNESVDHRSGGKRNPKQEAAAAQHQSNLINYYYDNEDGERNESFNNDHNVSYEERGESMYSRNKQWGERKRMNQEMLKDDLDRIATVECTFAPTVNPTSRRLLEARSQKIQGLAEQQRFMVSSPVENGSNRNNNNNSYVFLPSENQIRPLTERTPNHDNILSSSKIQYAAGDAPWEGGDVGTRLYNLHTDHLANKMALKKTQEERRAVECTFRPRTVHSQRLQTVSPRYLDPSNGVKRPTPEIQRMLEEEEKELTFKPTTNRRVPEYVAKNYLSQPVHERLAYVPQQAGDQQQPTEAEDSRPYHYEAHLLQSGFLDDEFQRMLKQEAKKKKRKLTKEEMDNFYERVKVQQAKKETHQKTMARIEKQSTPFKPVISKRAQEMQVEGTVATRSMAMQRRKEMRLKRYEAALSPQRKMHASQPLGVLTPSRTGAIPSTARAQTPTAARRQEGGTLADQMLGGLEPSDGEDGHNKCIAEGFQLAEYTFTPKLDEKSKKYYAPQWQKHQETVSQKRQQKLEKMMVEKALEEESECIFRPNISEFAQEQDGHLSHAVKGDYKTFQLYLDQQKFKKQSCVRQIRDQESEKEKSVCTFHPEVHAAPEYIKTIANTISLSRGGDPRRQQSRSHSSQRGGSQKPDWRFV